MKVLVAFCVVLKCAVNRVREYGLFSVEGKEIEIGRFSASN